MKKVTSVAKAHKVSTTAANPAPAKKESKVVTEKNDCTVVAVQVTKGITYEQALAYAKENLGRTEESKEGPSLEALTKALNKDKDYSALKPASIQNVYKLKTGPVVRSMTVGSFVKKYPTGKYLIVINKHALPVVDGVVVDTMKVEKRRILAGWKIKETAVEAVKETAKEELVAA